MLPIVATLHQALGYPSCKQLSSINVYSPKPLHPLVSVARGVQVLCKAGHVVRWSPQGLRWQNPGTRRLSSVPWTWAYRRRSRSLLLLANSARPPCSQLRFSFWKAVTNSWAWWSPSSSRPRSATCRLYWKEPRVSTCYWDQQ